MLVHGGQLAQIAAQYNINQSEWLDLSTGIAAHHYPIADIPISAYQQLPQPNQQLMDAAKNYYCHTSLMVTNGSQSIIKLIPRLWLKRLPEARDVYIPLHGYKEHQLAWADGGYAINHYDTQLPAIESLTQHCVLVIINPNNPTGQCFTRDDIYSYQQALSKVNGLLIVDEAFIDVINPSQSFASTIVDTNTIVLRSFGKFFGLAGIRIGFVLANKQWIDKLSQAIGPWQVNGPAQHIAAQALTDTHWQEMQRKRLSKETSALNTALHRHFPSIVVKSISGTNLFQTVNFNEKINAQQLYEQLCKRAVYVRLCDNQNSLRFGIPTPNQLVRLKQTLTSILSDVDNR